jgi:hypothetical protein
MDPPCANATARIALGLVQADDGFEAALDAQHFVGREASQWSLDEPLSIERSRLMT